jgi:two-component system, NtrC family, sensor kinase
MVEVCHSCRLGFQFKFILIRVLCMFSAALPSTHRDQQFRLLEQVFDANPDWMFVKDRADRYLLVNRAYAAAISIPVADILGKTDLEIVATAAGGVGNLALGIGALPTRSPGAIASPAPIATAPAQTQARVRAADGTDSIRAVQTTPLRDDQGEIYGVLVIARDVTDWVQAAVNAPLGEQTIADSSINDRPAADTALVESEAQFRRLVEEANDLIATWTLDGIITYLSPNFVEFSGYPVADFVGKSFAPLIHPDDLPAVHQFNQEVAITGEKRQNFEFRQVRKNGQVHWLTLSISPIKDANGTVTGFQGILRDISDLKRAEAELQASQRRLAALIQQAPIGIIDWTPERRVKGWNASAEKIFGFSYAEALDQKFEFIVPEIAKPQVSALLDALLVQKSAVCSVSDNVTQAGNIITCEWHNQPLIDEANQVVGLLSMVIDITDRTAAATALRQREQDLQTINRCVPGVIYQYVIDRSMGQNSFSYISPRCVELFELESDALITNPELFWALIHPQDLPRLQASNTSVLEHSSSWLDEFRILTASGQEKWIQGQSQRELIAGGSSVHNGIFIDITDRKRTEAQLKQQRQTLRTIIDNAPCWIWMTSPQGRLQLVNRRFCQDVGLAEADLIAADHYSDVMGIEASKSCMASDLLALNSAQLIQENEIMLLSDGQRHAMEILKTRLQNDAGKIVSVIGIGVDVTQQKQAEATLRDREQQLHQQATDLTTALSELQRTQSQLVQSEKMSSLGQLVAGVAHEINNPMSFIYGNLTYADEHTQDLVTVLAAYQQAYPHPDAALAAKIAAIDLEFILQDLPRLIDSMKIGAERVQEIILSLRTFSRLDEAAYKQADIHEGLDSSLMILQHRLRSQTSRPTIQVTKAYGDLPLVNCYAGQLNQVFMNILTNAIDALEEEWNTNHLAHLDSSKGQPQTPEISITTACHAQSVVIRIANNGPRIPETTRQRLFDPFFTTKPIGKGTGMGLSISYQIVTENHHGSLECDSVTGHDTEFVITIPLQRYQEPRSARGLGSTAD